MTPTKAPAEYQRLRDAGYVRSAGIMLSQIDLLVAVWDGRREEGVAGTAHVVRGAVEAAIPVVWISTLEDSFARMVEDLEDDGRPVAPDADCLGGSLSEALSRVVSMPAESVLTRSARHAPTAPQAMDALRDFFSEEWPKPSRWVTYDLFKRRVERKALRLAIHPEPLSSYGEPWQAFLQEAPVAGPLSVRIAEILLPRYAWADALAVDYAHRYRSAYFNAFLLAALTVSVALVGVFVHQFFATLLDQLAFKAILVLVELFLIRWIYKIVTTGQRARWRERWVEYRALAELLWSARFLAYFGQYGRVQRGGGDLESTTDWFLWYLRATLRELGLPDAVLDGTYQRAHLVAVEKHVIAAQLKYHRDNAKTLERMHHGLHQVGYGLFAATYVMLILFLLGGVCFAVWMRIEGISWQIFGLEGVLASTGQVSRPHGAIENQGAWLVYAMSSITFLAAFLPMLGAVLGGIRESGDFDRFSARSDKTADALQELAAEVAHAKSKLRLETTLDVLFSTAQVLTDDLAAWQAVYGRKRLDLPA
ncbi:MAG: hypothetical protein ACHQAY_18535 [Hyphomicrobiales bacterium]